MWRSGCRVVWIKVLTVHKGVREAAGRRHAERREVAVEINKALLQCVSPESITRGQRHRFNSKALDHWAYRNGGHVDFIRPGRPAENGFIESFNGKLRDECPNVEVFFNLADARRKPYLWRPHYNHQRPHSALDDRTTAEFAATCAAAAQRVPQLTPGHVATSLSMSLLEALT